LPFKRKIAGITALFLFLVMPLLIILFDPGVEHLHTGQSLCPFKMLTGLPCPGCGMIKSMVSLYRGEWMQSFEYHLFGPLLVLFFAGAMVVMVMEVIRGKKLTLPWLYNSKIAWGTAITMGIWHLVRIIIFICTHSPGEILKESIWA